MACTICRELALHRVGERTRLRRRTRVDVDLRAGPVGMAVQRNKCACAEPLRDARALLQCQVRVLRTRENGGVAEVLGDARGETKVQILLPRTAGTCAVRSRLPARIVTAMTRIDDDMRHARRAEREPFHRVVAGAASCR